MSYGFELSRQVDQLFNDPTLSDVSILLDNDVDSLGETKTFYGHRVVLAMMSDYFRTMLYGPFVEADQREIRLNDVPYSAFKRCMRCVYSGWVHGSFEEASLEEAEQFYMVARMLLIESTLKTGFCTWFKYKLPKWEAEIWRIVQFAIEFDLGPLIESSIDYFSQIANCCLRMESFNDLPLAVLKRVLNKRIMNCSKAELKQAINSWIKANNAAASQAEKQKLIDDVARFPTGCYNGRKVCLYKNCRSKYETPDEIMDQSSKEPPQHLFETPVEYSYSSELQFKRCLQLFGVTLVFESNMEYGSQYGKVKLELDIDFNLIANSNQRSTITRKVHVACDFTRQNKQTLSIFFQPFDFCSFHDAVVTVKWSRSGVQPNVLNFGFVDHRYVTIPSSYFSHIF